MNVELSPAQLILKEKFDAADATYEREIRNTHNAEQTAIARIRRYSQAYAAYKLEESRR